METRVCNAKSCMMVLYAAKWSCIACSDEMQRQRFSGFEALPKLEKPPPKTPAFAAAERDKHSYHARDSHAACGVLDWPCQIMLVAVYSPA